MTSATRSGAGSPSHDPLAAPGSGRFLSSKRCVPAGGAPVRHPDGAGAAQKLSRKRLLTVHHLYLGPGKSKPRRA